MRGLYAIVDVPHASGFDPIDVTRAILSGTRATDAGLAAVQLRAKSSDPASRIALLKRVGPLCREASVPLIVNDDVEAAFAGIEGVAGVHLGQDDASEGSVRAVRARADLAGWSAFIIGRSTHDPRQLRSACREPVDYVAYGPVVATRSKQGADPVVGFEGLLQACRSASRPVVAIGGLDENTGARTIELGAAAVAVIAGLLAPSLAEIEAQSKRLARAFSAAAQPLELDEVGRRVPVLTRDQLVELARWSDSLGTHVELGLPVRFRPTIVEGRVLYRPSDIIDLLYSLDKRDEENWAEWATRTDRPSSIGLVSLRLPQ